MSESKISTLMSLSLMAAPLSALAMPTPATIDQSKTSSWRTSLRKMHHQLAAVPLLEPERLYIGALEERWTFPSDHLPIGVSMTDSNSSFRVVSWNVLNSAYMRWIYEDEQGLAKSNLTKENFSIKDNGLTLREQHVIDSLRMMVDSSDFPSNMICLQECSAVFIQELELQLPSHMKIVRSSDTPVKNQNIILYDANLFGLIEKNLHTQVFASEPNRPLMEVVLEKNGVRYRIFNAHLRCDISLPQRFELAQFVSSRQSKDEITLVLGDLNVSQTQMKEALASTDNPNAFLPFSPYRTTVSPDLESKTIDHIFIDSGETLLKIRENSPNEILEGLQELVDLLNNGKTVQRSADPIDINL